MARPKKIKPPPPPTITVKLDIKAFPPVTVDPLVVEIDPKKYDTITWIPGGKQRFTFCTLEFRDKVHPFLKLEVLPDQITVDDDNKKPYDYEYIIWVHGGADNKRYSSKPFTHTGGPTIKNK